MAIRTITDIVFPVPSSKFRKDLEEFRLEFESKFGPTDLTKRYTSTLSNDQQLWLATEHPERYFDGLPSFVQAFFRDRLTAATSDGRFDDIATPLLVNMLRVIRAKSGPSQDR